MGVCFSNGKKKAKRKAEAAAAALVQEKREEEYRKRLELPSTGVFDGPRDELLKEERPLINLAKSTHFNIGTIRKLQLLWQIHAGGAHGTISAKQMAAVVGLDFATHPLAGPLFRHFDKTKTSQINFRTFVATLSALSPQADAEDKIKFSFGLLDTKEQGYIPRSELELLLTIAVRDLGLVLSSDEMKACVSASVSELRTSFPDRISFPEYAAFAKNSPTLLESITLDAAALVEELDLRSKSGRLSQLLSTPSGPLTPAQIDIRTQSFVQVVTSTPNNSRGPGSKAVYMEDETELMGLADIIPTHRLSVILPNPEDV
eukprot:gb/GEZN01012786.1/.p1 GENE.gb/GEZN01012786.1/~~gb/GEZN01012786.1/.p1  ORF type:complete len:317 (+),score=72.43 gb/GEZN01012786.1/:85-1035(+)